MDKFQFLIGNWLLKYSIPGSRYSEPADGDGEGTFRRVLNDRYVFFDYRARLTTGSAAAHGIFARDQGENRYRYWWFEDSGVFMTAECRFHDDETLFMDWEGSPLTQTFRRTAKDHVVLEMIHMIDDVSSEPVLRVDLFSRTE